MNYYHIFLIGFVSFMLMVQPAMAVSLKQQSLVQGDVITLGDLFNGLEDSKSGHVLGAAPRPGQDMVLSARTLMRVAKAMDVRWQPASTADVLTVRRAATVIDKDAVSDFIRAALRDEGVDGLYDLSFITGDVEIILPPSFAATADVASVKHNAETGWFEAVLVAPSKANPEIERHFSGKIERLTEVPVLRDVVRAGMIIGARDIQMVTVPSRSLNHDVILNAETLYGLTPRRLLQAGKPVKEQEVEQPRIVERGQNVTMIYQQGPLQLTVLGKALEFGAKGDLIRVVNNQSNRSIDAVVTGEREVTVKVF